MKGCDGSLLLDDTDEMVGEKLALSNIDSLRSYEVIDEIKDALERACPGVVSCADVIIMAARDAVVLSGGPHWEVKLGRQDSLTASQEASNDIMPSPRANATYLTTLFTKFNLSVQDLALQPVGLGPADPTIDQYREKLDRLCPLGGDEEVTGDLDVTPERFDNQYYKDLVSGRGFLNSDQTLYTFDETREYVEVFSRDESEFFRAFVEGMIRLGDLQSGLPGEIRRKCRVVNNGPVEELLQTER
ncbi:hypothetical protein DH2020_031242 [Rehmannia glutinosa]|uniref:peroxidase n=1 Tax=Rehmannia glutinosa TaxID=99300 RepID=A0ABR0VKW7_REHGL